MPTPIVEQRRAAKKKQKCKFIYLKYDRLFLLNFIDKESSSGEEYQNDEDEAEEEYPDDDDDSVEDLEPKTRRSSAAKRKSIAILSKDKTESWGNYRNTIDNGPVPCKSIETNKYLYLLSSLFL